MPRCRPVERRIARAVLRRNDHHFGRRSILEGVPGHDRHAAACLQRLGRLGHRIEIEGGIRSADDRHGLEYLPGSGEVDDHGPLREQERHRDRAGRRHGQRRGRRTPRRVGRDDGSDRGERCQAEGRGCQKQFSSIHGGYLLGVVMRRAVSGRARDAKAEFDHAGVLEVIETAVGRPQSRRGASLA
jgi:hypothetical protein